MPRLKHRRVAIALGLFFLILTCNELYQQRQAFIASSLFAAQTIYKAIGDRDSSSSRLVLPNVSTVLLQPIQRCKGRGRDVFALFMVISSPENRDRRNAIRIGWGSALNNDMKADRRRNKVLFFTGIRQNGQIPIDLEEEWKLAGDLIVEDLMDNYLNLTLKVLRMQKWKQSHCPLATYLIKIDDDVHVNVPKFINQLKSYSGQEAHNLVGGHKYNHSYVVRNPDSKWFVPSALYTPSKLPKFVSGTCYVLGIDAVPKIYQAALERPLFHLEDVFLTGMIAGEALKMKLTHISEFAVFWGRVYSLITTSCAFTQEFVGVHSASLENLRCWNHFNSKDFVCDYWPILLHC